MMSNDAAQAPPEDAAAAASGAVEHVSSDAPPVATLGGTFLRAFAGPAARGFLPPQFLQPSGIIIDNERNRYVVSDSGNHRIVSIHRISLEVMWQFGELGEAGASAKRLNEPQGIVLSADGAHVLVVDSSNHRVLTLRADDGQFVASFGQRGTGHNQLRNPSGIAIGPDGRCVRGNRCVVFVPHLFICRARV